MGILVSGQADKIARQYRWLNLHPATETQAVQSWFATSQTKFREHQQVFPLVLQGETGSGRRYLLEAAHFRQTYAGLPVTIFHWDMELRDAPDLEAQFEHMQAKLENFGQQLEMQNPSLWARLQTLGEAVEAKLPIKFGQAEMSVNLKKVVAALFLPVTGQDNRDGQNPDVFDRVEALFRELLQDGNVILHVRNAELLDIGLLERLWRTVRWLNDAAEADTGFMGLAFSFTPAFPLAELLGDRNRYALASVMPLSVQRVLTALRETFGQRIADDEFVQWLLTHTALHSGAVDAKHLGQLLDRLLDEGLLAQQAGGWVFAPTDDLQGWRKIVGRNIEELWQERGEFVPAHQQPLLRQLFGLAALGGEWIPVEVLLDYLGVTDKTACDDLIDVLDEVYVNTSPALLYCADWHFAGMQEQGLVYRFQSPLLPALLIDPATRQEQTRKLLDWLQKRWASPSRNQAAYLLRLANHADRPVAQALRERLAWQVESEFAAELQQYLEDKLENGELSVATLNRIMWKHLLVWPMPRSRAICRAWFSYYQQNLRNIPDDSAHAGEGWDDLWKEADDPPILATQEGISLCYFYGYTQIHAGEYTKAEQLFHWGLSLCQKRPDMDMEARFHSILAHVDYLKDELDSSEKRLRDFALPMFQRLGNTRSIAVAYGRIANILNVRGQLDEALKIYQTEELPVYEKLGDVRSKAITMGQIANILQVRGQLDEALNIRQTVQLPVYEKLGDVRSKAKTLGNIADILQARGQLDEALDIYQTEELPVYEKLGDVRSKAETLGNIADILQARGQLDEALNIRQTVQLPVYEKLGDVRSKAVTMGQIAGILQVRGQLDEAFNILNVDTLPVFQRLGCLQCIAKTMGQIADILKERGQLDDALNIYQGEIIPIVQKLGNVKGIAVTMGKIADILQSRNRLDSVWQFINGEKTLPTETTMAQALQTLAEIFVTFQKLQDARQIGHTYSHQADIHQVSGGLQQALELREQEIAVFTTSGYAHELLVSRAKLAILLWQRDANLHAGQITELLCQSQAEASRMKIPEAGQIGEILAQMGLSCDQ